MEHLEPTAGAGRPNRRVFLKYVGGGIGAATVGPLQLAAVSRGAAGGTFDEAAAPGPAGAWCRADGSPDWRPVAYPVPSPGDGGSADTDARRLATYSVADELLLPDGFRYGVLAAWGDEFGSGGAAERVRFGYNCDYTGLVPVAGRPGEYWLIVNHEYISARPWLQGFAAVHGPAPVDADGRLAALPLAGASLDLADGRFLQATRPELKRSLHALCEAAMSDLGVTVLRVRRADDGTFAVVRDAADHFRIAGRSAQNVPAGSMHFTGPAAPLLGGPVGTFANCSGATTPWGTFLVCEENFQDQVAEHVAPDGAPLSGASKRFRGVESGPAATKLPFEFDGLGTGVEPPLDGRQYGWVVEIDPVRRTMHKHTALGRFRHENVAVRCEAGRPLAAYMGDDRRGGHLWKFVSKGVVADPKDPANTALFRDGTLYVARLEPDFAGRWVALDPSTSLRRPEPHRCAGGQLWLPRRPGGGHVLVAVDGHDAPHVSADDWVRSAEAFAGKPFDRLTLGDLAAKDADAGTVIALDAYVMANAVGGTPCARPEDVEIHPIDRSVYVAFTDSTGSGEGSPDAAVFPDSAGANSRQYGAIYRIAEDGDDPAARTFQWGKFVSSGEVADGGGGFACADNLCFDPAGNLWMVCDITTPAHNFPARRDDRGNSAPGDKFFPGVFGNNAMFMIPTAGPNAGVPFCFAVAPCEAELTGPTFTEDGKTLILSVQHPGELNGTRGMPGVDQPPEEKRTLEIAARDGKVFAQERTVPIGSNFPSGRKGDVPRPCVVCITRA